MLVLSLIALIAASAALYGFIVWFNHYTYEKARYTFFTMQHTAGMVLAYGMIFFGNRWFQNALTTNGDPLNGKLVMTIGVIILISIIVNNFKKVPLKYALMGSAVQLVLYIPITVAAVFIIAGLFAFLARTQPVFNLNERD